MKYKYTDRNIVDLLHDVGMLNEDQIVKFFSNETPPNRVRALLRKLSSEHIIGVEVDSKGNRFYFPIGYEPVNDNLKKRKMLAFWAVAGIGSQEVTSIYAGSSSLLTLSVICNFEIVYDFIVIEQVNEIYTAARVLASYLPKNVQDVMPHIAVLYRKEQIDEFRPALIECGFDGWCYIDYNNKQPIFEMFE